MRITNDFVSSRAVAEPVKGTETCTAEKNNRTINGKKYVCSTKCTTPVTNTTCKNGACSTSVYNEVTYKDCEEAPATIKGQLLQQFTIQPQQLQMQQGPSPTKPLQPLHAKPSGTLLQQ